MTNESPGALSWDVAGMGGIRLRVIDPNEREPTLRDIVSPFAVIGRSSRADVQLSGPGVSYRHCYLQALTDGVFCIDLGSKTGIFWGGGKRRRAFGWLTGTETLRIGRCKLALNAEGDSPPPSAVDAHDREVPLDPHKCDVHRFSRYTLEVWDGSKKSKRIEVDRVLSLVGRWSSCPIRLPSKSVSRVHCSLVLTPEGLHVVGLLGKGGIAVNEQPTRTALLEHGDKLSIGRYVIRVHLQETVDDVRDDVRDDVERGCGSAPAPAEPPQPVDPQPVDEVPVQQTVKAPATETAAATAAQKTDWMGTLFRIEHVPHALVVLPNISSGSFRYAKLQAEANALRRKLEEPDHRNLIIDLQGLNYIGSEAIGVVISLARRVTDRGGKVALCRASDDVREVMQNMGLLRLWPHYATRDEALRVVSEP